MPALAFVDGGSDRIVCGTVATAPTVFTILSWVFPTALTVNRRIAGKGGFSGFINFGLHGAGTAAFALYIDYATTDAAAISVDSALVANTWQFLGGSFDGSAAPKLYRGLLTAAAAEPSYGATPVAPAGARVVEAEGNLYVGNQSTFDKGWPGQISWVGWWNRVLSQVEIQEIQERLILGLDYTELLGGCVGLWMPGTYPPVGNPNIPDLSGRGNHGTITGATLVLNTAPLSRIAAPFGPPIWQSYKAPAGGGNVTVTPGAIALSMSMLAPRPRIRTLPGAIALSAALPAVTPRVRTLPGVVGLTTALPSVSPRLRVLPGVIGLTAALPAPTPRVRALPGAIALLTAVQTPTPRVRALPSVVALTAAVLTPTPRLRVSPSVVALVTAVLAPTPRLRAQPSAVALVTALLAPQPRIRVLPGVIALVTSLLAATPRVRVHPSPLLPAAQFTAPNQEYLSRADNASLSIGDDDAWLSIWINLDSTPANSMGVAGKWASANTEWLLYRLVTGSKWAWIVRDAANANNVEVISTAASPVIGTWAHLFVYHDKTADVIGISVNGAAFDTTPLVGGIRDGTAAFEIGRFLTNYLDGKAGNAAFGKNVVGGFATTPAATIRDALRNGGNGVDLSAISAGDKTAWGAVSAWPLQEASGQRNDVWGSNHLTDNNTVTSADGPHQSRPIGLGLSFPAPTPRIRVLPSVISLVLTTPAPSIPGAGNVTATPAVIALTLAALAATPRIRALPPAVALSMALLAPRPLLRVKPSVVALVASVLAATPRVAARPGTVALVVALPGVGLRVVTHPGVIALLLSLPAVTIPGPVVPGARGTVVTSAAVVHDASGSAVLVYAVSGGVGSAGSVETEAV